MKKHDLHHLIKAKKELHEEADSLLGTLLQEIEFLTNDPEYFTENQKKLRDRPHEVPTDD